MDAPPPNQINIKNTITARMGKGNKPVPNRARVTAIPLIRHVFRMSVVSFTEHPRNALALTTYLFQQVLGSLCITLLPMNP